MNRNLQTTAFGALGGLLGFVLSEMLTPAGASQSLVETIVGTAIWTALFVLPLTLVLAASDNVLSMRGRWSRGLLSTIVPTALLGAVAGAVAQTLYAVGLAADIHPRLIRALGWGVMGGGVGVVLGLLDRSWPKTWRGLLGGAVGGFIGGLAFDSFQFALTKNDTGTLARAFGLTVLGAAIGSMLRLSQELFKTSWLLGTGGRYEGKQYILAKPTVTLGRSDSNDIGLYSETGIPLQAGAFRRQGEQWVWQGEMLSVNGNVQPEVTLQHGDRLTIGQTTFLFQSKNQAQAAGPVPVAPHRYMLEGTSQIVPLPGQFDRVLIGSRGTVNWNGSQLKPEHAELFLTGARLEILAHAPAELNGQPLPMKVRVPVKVGDQLTFAGQEFTLIWGSLVAPQV